MNRFVIIIIFLLLLGCTRKTERPFIPKEYRRPLQNIGKGKVYLYANEGNVNDTDEEQITRVGGPTSSYLLSKYFKHGRLTESILMDTNGKYIEIVFYSLKKLNVRVKENIVKDEIINDGSKLGRSTLIFQHEKDGFTTLREVIGSYLKDTIMEYGGHLLPTLVTQASFLLKLRANNEQDDRIRDSSFGLFYYAKGVGTVKSVIYTKSGVRKSKLVSINSIE